MNIEKESLRLVASAKNYNKWVFSLIKPHVESPVLEVGSGIGTITSFLLKGNTVTASEFDKKYLSFLKNKFRKRKKFKDAIFLDLTKYKKVEKFKTVVCTNVLHHIKDDKKAIQNMYRYLEKGGRLVLQEPASPFLFGSLDKAQNHYRRYDLQNISRKLEKAGFQVEKSFYFNVLGFFGWWLNSRLLGKKTINDNQMTFVDIAIMFSSKVESFIKPPFGLSVFIVARKTK